MVKKIFTDPRNIWNGKEEWFESLSRVYRDTVHVNYRIVDTDLLVNYILDAISKYCPTGVKVTDFCGGWGRISLPLAKMGIQSRVIDGSHRYLNEGQTIARKWGISDLITFEYFNLCDIEKFKFENNNVFLFIEGIEYFCTSDRYRILSVIKDKMKSGDLLIVTAVDKLAYTNFQIRKMLFFSKIIEMFCEDKFVDLAGNPFVPLNNTEFHRSLPIDDSFALVDKRKYLQMDNLINAVGNFMQSSYFDHSELASRLVDLNYKLMFDDEYKDYGFFHIATMRKE